VHSIDVAARHTTVARLHAAETGSGVAYTAVPGETLAAPGDIYDVVLNMDVILRTDQIPCICFTFPRAVIVLGRQ
jgi:2-polyprenyl-3-methyl-5-hydroxy-6-metoxy-1,4-benzoquinol methylase